MPSGLQRHPVYEAPHVPASLCPRACKRCTVGSAPDVLVDGAAGAVAEDAALQQEHEAAHALAVVSILHHEHVHMLPLLAHAHLRRRLAAWAPRARPHASSSTWMLCTEVAGHTEQGKGVPWSVGHMHSRTSAQPAGQPATGTPAGSANGSPGWREGADDLAACQTPSQPASFRVERGAAAQERTRAQH